MHVAVGFMPAFNYLQKNSLIVLERGHKAHGYESAVDRYKNSTGLPAADDAIHTFNERYSVYLRFKALLGSTATLRMSVFVVTSNPIE